MSQCIFTSRSSRPEVFRKKAVLRNFVKFTGKNLCQRLFLTGLQLYFKKWLWKRCFPVNFGKFLSRYFRPKLVHWNESVYCTPFDRPLKNAIQWGVAQHSTMTNHSWVMRNFVKSVVLFFGQNKYTNIRRF